MFSNQSIIHGESLSMRQRWITLTLNTDGCSQRSSNQAGGGGEDYYATMREGGLGGFSARFGTCLAVEAELRALIHGLHIAWNRGISDMVVEID